MHLWVVTTTAVTTRPFVTMLSRAGARGGRIAVMVVAASLSCLAAAVLVGGRVGWHAVLLDPFDGAPRDPIVTPLLMGYDAEQRAARELARIAGPLQGAFSPTSQAQIYQSLRGLTTPGPGGGRLLVAPGGSEYELEALPLSRRQRLADEFVPVGDDKYDDELTRQALESYRQDQSAASDGALRAQALEGLGAGRQPFATSYGGRDVDDDDITRKALESYRQELAVPLPAEVEEPVALDAHALPVEGSAPAARAARKRVSRDKVRRLFERLQNPRDRAAAEVLVREDELARSLNAAVQKERPLQTLEGQMDKELRLTGIKMRDAQQVSRSLLQATRIKLRACRRRKCRVTSEGKGGCRAREGRCLEGWCLERWAAGARGSRLRVRGCVLQDAPAPELYVKSCERR